MLPREGTLMRKHTVRNAVLLLCSMLLAVTCAHRTPAQTPASTYPKMAPIEQYLMNRDAEIALARSAAPDAISHDASVLVLTRHGYETTIEGKNGWTCMVDRGWGGMLDYPDFWNPKIRAAGCLNPSAARSFLPYDLKRTELILGRHSKKEIIAATQDAIAKKELPMLESGSMCYMMSKTSYLFDQGDNTMSHVMFYTADGGAPWGANVANSPIMGVSYWSASPDTYPQLRTFPRIFVSLILADKWSDGTPAMHM
jgi:hypothetical protein